MQLNDEQSDDYRKPFIFRRLSLDADADDNEYRNLDALHKWQELYFMPITKGSLRASILCLLCVTLGSSLLSLPFTMKSLGVVLCLIIFFLSAFLTHWTLKLVADVSIRERVFDYPGLVGLFYGRNLVALTIIMCLVNNLGSIVAWNKFISNILTNILDYYCIEDFIINTGCTKLILSILIVILIQVPVCTLNTIARLHVLSILGCLLILYVILISIFEFPYYFHKNFSPDKIVYFNFNVDLIQTFCIFFFAFGNHSTITNAINELNPNTDKRIYKLVNYTSFSEIFFYFITMMVGYFSTYDQTSEIYINRDYQSIYMIIGKFLYIGVMICNIGLYYYMIKPYLDYAFGGNFKTHNKLA